jgi:hypothetical protein
MEISMTLKKWALITEISSGIAVVVTLVLLMMEVNKNTEATQIATYEAISSELNALDLKLAADPELTSLYFGKESDLTELEEQTKFLVGRYAFRTFESAYFAYKGGSLNDGQWQRFERNVCALWNNLSVNQRRDFSYNATEDFIHHLDSYCDGNTAE